MNKTTFLSKLREAVEGESNEVIKMLFVQAANYYREDKFDDVLKLFKRNDKTIFIDEDYNLLDKATELCERIEDAEYDIDWGWGSWDDEDSLFDNDGLGKEIQDLLEKTISYVMAKKYEEAYKVFDMLFDVSIPTNESDDIDIETLFSNDLISLDLTDVTLYYACSAIMYLKGIDRCEDLYYIMGISNYSINLPSIVAIN
ncbi:MAG: hypothetical protein FWC47_11815 [Oscillospiraceae bacterium]|nr:hypothetical protein [Oscillospiraceae bacterium]